MIKSEKKAVKIQERRVLLGARGISAAVRRYYKRRAKVADPKKWVDIYISDINKLDANWEGCKHK